MARGDILLVELPASQGREQAGFRPVVAVQTDTSTDHLPTLMIIPFTGRIGALRFPYTIQVEPSNSNGLTQPSVLLIFQLRAIDRSRIQRKIGELEQRYLEQLDREMHNLLNLN